MVGATGLEPATQCFQNTRYAICDSPYEKQVMLCLLVIVNCSTWEEWNKSDKFWEPISKGKIIDDGAEKFCKRSFFGLGSF